MKSQTSRFPSEARKVNEQEREATVVMAVLQKELISNVALNAYNTKVSTYSSFAEQLRRVF